MSYPRRITKGATYLVTRRTSQRMFLLLPSKKANQAFRYCLALAQQKTGVRLHAVVVMSNHYHLVVTDPDGVLPKFVEELNRLVARSLNCAYGRWENFWAGNVQTSYVQLTDAASVLDKMVYTITNPVTADLVWRASDWPGESLWRPSTYIARRPTFFFRQEGGLPKKLRLELDLPDAMVGKSGVALISERVRQVEAERRARHKELGTKPLGAKRVKAQRITDSPTTREPRRKLSPRVAGRDKWLRIEVLQRLKSFVREYRDARKRWVAGERNVVFPCGTYGMRMHHGARCATT